MKLKENHRLKKMNPLGVKTPGWFKTSERKNWHLGHHLNIKRGQICGKSGFLDSALSTIRTKIWLGSLKTSRNCGPVWIYSVHKVRRSIPARRPVDSWVTGWSSRLPLLIRCGNGKLLSSLKVRKSLKERLCSALFFSKHRNLQS